MTPHEKAVNAINARLERLQANLQAAQLESSRRFMFQSLVVTVGLAQGLNNYARMLGQYAQRRHAEVKQNHETLAAQHASALASGKEWLEKLKANPSDPSIRKAIEAAQQEMVAIQKVIRRGANTLQRELAPGMALIDEISVSVRRFTEAEQGDELKRVIKTVIEQVRDFYRTHPVPAKDIVSSVAWEESAMAEISQAIDFHDAYVRAGMQLALALEWLTMALSPNPPLTTEDATFRANEILATRLKAVTMQLSTGGGAD